MIKIFDLGFSVVFYPSIIKPISNSLFGVQCLLLVSSVLKNKNAHQNSKSMLQSSSNTINNNDIKGMMLLMMREIKKML